MLSRNIISFFILIISVVIVGLPIILLATNIYFFIAQTIISFQVGVPIPILILFTLPHAIIEFGVLIIATSLGLYIPLSVFETFIKDNIHYFSKNNTNKYFQLILLGTLFLIPAAIIETGMIEFFRIYFKR